MEKQLFVSIVERYYPWISCLEKAAFQIDRKSTRLNSSHAR